VSVPAGTASAVDELRALVDAALREHLPRGRDGAWLEALVDQPRFGWDWDALERGFLAPFHAWADAHPTRLRPVLAGLLTRALGADPRRHGAELAALEMHYLAATMVESLRNGLDLRTSATDEVDIPLPVWVTVAYNARQLAPVVVFRRAEALSPERRQWLGRRFARLLFVQGMAGAADLWAEQQGVAHASLYDYEAHLRRFVGPLNFALACDVASAATGLDGAVAERLSAAGAELGVALWLNARMEGRDRGVRWTYPAGAGELARARGAALARARAGAAEASPAAARAFDCFLEEACAVQPAAWDPAAYSDDFLVGMDPVLAEDYRAWLPFCRSAVVETVERIGSRSFVERSLGASVPDATYAVLREAWYAPYRSYHERNGKLLRPYLVCLCLKAYGRDPEAYVPVVASAEIIHAASLVLDDIADDSPLRRGGPTAHRQVGTRVAGAAASAWLNSIFELLDAHGLPDGAAETLLQETAWEHWVTGVGTTIDTTWPWLRRYDRTPNEYLQSVVHRSTSYTYRLPLKIGALAAGAGPEEVRLFAAYGEELGLSFQIIDDILNVKPDNPHWGKQVGEDLTQGKITLQVLLALDGAKPRARARLVQILEARTDVPEVLSEAVEIMEESGAFETARRMVADHVQRTKTIADEMTFLDIADRQRLRALVDYVVTRSR
jgi:geranylgeranyl pyrophosphate synthase